MELLEFIKSTTNWKEVLSSEPYNVRITNVGNFYMFKYDILSKWNELTKQCRGVIIDLDKMEYSCAPFHKFFNYGEAEADVIDWSSAKVLEKCDGSLCKIWFNKYTNSWNWSTNGTIHACDAGLPESIINPNIKNYQDLIDYTLMGMGYPNLLTHGFTHQSIENTHMFELCTPLNRVVVPHKTYQLYYLGSRNNVTGQEFSDRTLQQLFPIPKVFSLKTIEDCVNASKELPFDQEGYVVVDKDYHRVKIKGLRYLSVHRMLGEGVLTEKRALDIIRLGECDEFLSYYENYKPFFKTLQNKITKFTQIVLNDTFKMFEFIDGRSRKDVALFIQKNCKVPSIMFKLYDHKIKNVQEGIDQLHTDVLLRLLNEKDNAKVGNN